MNEILATELTKYIRLHIHTSIDPSWISDDELLDEIERHLPALITNVHDALYARYGREKFIISMLEFVEDFKEVK